MWGGFDDEPDVENQHARRDRSDSNRRRAAAAGASANAGVSAAELIGQGGRHRMYSAGDPIADRHDGRRRRRSGCGRRLEVHPDESLARVGRDRVAEDVSARRRGQPADGARRTQGGSHRHARREAGPRWCGRALEAEGRVGEDDRRQLHGIASPLDILGECP